MFVYSRRHTRSGLLPILYRKELNLSEPRGGYEGQGDKQGGQNNRGHPPDSTAVAMEDTEAIADGMKRRNRMMRVE